MTCNHNGRCPFSDHPQVFKQNFPTELPSPLTLFVIHGRGDQPLMGTPQQWLFIFIMHLVTLSFWGSHWGKKKKKLPGAIGETINQPRRGNEPGHDRDQYLAVNVWRNHGNFY